MNKLYIILLAALSLLGVCTSNAQSLICIDQKSIAQAYANGKIAQDHEELVNSEYKDMTDAEARYTAIITAIEKNLDAMQQGQANVEAFQTAGKNMSLFILKLKQAWKELEELPTVLAKYPLGTVSSVKLIASTRENLFDIAWCAAQIVANGEASISAKGTSNTGKRVTHYIDFTERLRFFDYLLTKIDTLIFKLYHIKYNVKLFNSSGDVLRFFLPKTAFNIDIANKILEDMKRLK